MTSSHIRSHEIKLDHDNIRFTVQTDVCNLFDYRRRILSDIINGLNLDHFTTFAIMWHNLMKDKTFFNVTKDFDNSEVQLLMELGGEIIVTRNPGSNDYDYFMNVMFQ